MRGEDERGRGVIGTKGPRGRGSDVKEGEGQRGKRKSNGERGNEG